MLIQNARFIIDDIDDLIRRARKRLSRADILIHTAVIKLVGEPDLVIGYEEFIEVFSHLKSADNAEYSSHIERGFDYRYKFSKICPRFVHILCHYLRRVDIQGAATSLDFYY